MRKNIEVPVQLLYAVIVAVLLGHGVAAEFVKKLLGH